MTEQVEPEVWQIRAAAWELLALSLRYPEAALADALASGEWVDAAREIAGAAGISLPEGWGADLPAVGDAAVGTIDSQALLHTLRAEATRLFVGAPDPVCSPYEGVWRAADDGVQALLFVNPHSMDVERFCKACGLGRPEGTNEPLDHVATECELLEHLALRAAEDAVASEVFAGGEVPEALVMSAELPGGSAAAAYDAFLAEHGRTWVPRFAEAVARETREPLYRAVAAFLEAAVNAA